MLREHDVIESGDDCGKLHFLIDRVEHHREEFERTGGDVSGTVTARSPGLSAVDAVLLGILTVVWVRNYRTVGSGMTAGPAGVRGDDARRERPGHRLFLAPECHAGDPTAQRAAVVRRAIQTVALVVLTYVRVKRSL